MQETTLHLEVLAVYFLLLTIVKESQDAVVGETGSMKRPATVSAMLPPAGQTEDYMGAF